MSRMLNLVVLAHSVFAALVPLAACPSVAYLTYNGYTGIAEIDLSTLDYVQYVENEAGDHIFANNQINAIGFDKVTSYIYGLINRGPEGRSVVRIGNDDQGSFTYDVWPNDLTSNAWSADVVNFDSEPNGFYVFKVGSLLKYYVLPTEGEDPPAEGFTSFPITGRTSGLGADIAFHPDASALEHSVLYSIGTSKTEANLTRAVINFTNDPPTVQTTILGVLGLEDGTEIDRDGKAMGALYFTEEGYIYAIATVTGFLYRWPVPADQAGAVENLNKGELIGPLPTVTGNVDAARCYSAPLIAPEAGIDFGDAPDSYKTKIESNGPFHSFSLEEGAFWIGEVAPDHEDDARASIYENTGYPADELTGDRADELYGAEHGFVVPPITVGETNELQMSIGTFDNLPVSGLFVNVYIDWNDDGEFSECEVAVFNHPVDAPSQDIIQFDAPTYAKPGLTWARFRISGLPLSKIDGWNTVGGPGEVEDHLVEIIPKSIIYTTTSTSTLTTTLPQNSAVNSFFKQLDSMYRYHSTAASGALDSVVLQFDEQEEVLNFFDTVKDTVGSTQTAIIDQVDGHMKDAIGVPTDLLGSALSTITGFFNRLSV